MSASCSEIRKLADRWSQLWSLALQEFSVPLSCLLFTLMFCPDFLFWREIPGCVLWLSHGGFLTQLSSCYLIIFVHVCSLTLLSRSVCFFPPIAWIGSSAVPPKPAHLLALGQDKKPKRIPPAPSRPLPAPPPPPKPKPSLTPPGPGVQPQREAQKVGLLIERFENSRYQHFFRNHAWHTHILPS